MSAPISVLLRYGLHHPDIPITFHTALSNLSRGELSRGVLTLAGGATVLPDPPFKSASGLPETRPKTRPGLQNLGRILKSFFPEYDFYGKIEAYNQVRRPILCRLFRISAQGLPPKRVPSKEIGL